MAIWITILFFPLAFLNFKVEAYAQYYKTINKDGTISFSDNPTSSILQREPTQKTTGPQEELEKSSSPEPGRISDKESPRTSGFSDNPTSSISRKDPAKKTTAPQKELEKFSSPYPGKIPEKESSPSLLQKATEEQSSPHLMKLSLPGKNWALEFNFKDFKIEDSEILPDFKGRRIMATNNRTKVILSVFLTPAQKPLSHKELRDSSWESLKRLPFKREHIKKYETGQWAILEYIIKEAKGIKDVDQKNVFAYLVKDNIYIDFHLSKVLYTPADENLFKEFIASAKILDHFTPSSIDNFGYGSYFYLNKNYEKAIVYYEKALDQEKQKPRLQKKFWIVLVDNLGMAYGLSGNLKMA